MRILPLIAALCISATTCAGAMSVTALNKDAGEGGGYGDYLSARFAASHNDLGEAAK